MSNSGGREGKLGMKLQIRYQTSREKIIPTFVSDSWNASKAESNLKSCKIRIFSTGFVEKSEIYQTNEKEEEEGLL